MAKDMPTTDARHELTYKAIVETLMILSDEDFMHALRQGIREARQGKGIRWERAKRKLGL